MRMERGPRTDGPMIAGIGAQGFKVDEGYYPALLLTPQRADGWSPPPIASLDEAPLAPILGIAPEFVLLGTGATLVRPPAALVRALEARGIGIEAMDSRAAARAWGVLRAEKRTIAAALYPL